LYVCLLFFQETTEIDKCGESVVSTCTCRLTASRKPSLSKKWGL
jgi:hypothetical protein